MRGIFLLKNVFTGLVKIMRRPVVIAATLFLNFIPITIPLAEEGSMEILYFFSPGCRECEEVKELLLSFGERLGVELDIHYLDITGDKKNLELLLSWEDRTGKKAEGLIAVVVADKFLAGYEEIKEDLENILLNQMAGGEVEPETPSVSQTVKSEFGRFGPWAVLGAGLIDGINPCAFVVLVLLISFLTLAGESRAHMLRVGLAFALAVFLTYYLVGLGLFSAVVKSVAYRKVADSIYLAVGSLSFILGIISFYDAAVVYRSREIKDARLKLSPAILSRIQRVISRNFNPRHIFFSALILGFLISLFELVCTGQIYLPTIILIMQNQLLRKKALFYLFLYCLAFIVPLLIVFGMIYWGSGTNRIADLSRKYSWLSKLLTGVIFITLAVFLFAHF